MFQSIALIYYTVSCISERPISTSFTQLKRVRCRVLKLEEIVSFRSYGERYYAKSIFMATDCRQRHGVSLSQTMIEAQLLKEFPVFHGTRRLITPTGLTLSEVDPFYCYSIADGAISHVALLSANFNTAVPIFKSKLRPKISLP